MKFAFQEYWIWMLGIPVSLGIMFLVYKRVGQIIQTWFSSDQYARSYPFLKFILRGSSFALLFIALLGPYSETREEQVSIMGREVYIILDVSASMNATDIHPSRLSKAKQEIKKLVDHLKGDKIGLIVYTEHPYNQCPLTQDHEAVKLFIDMAQTDQYQQTGTQLRSALVMALDRFQNTQKDASQISRAIVLISDGEDYGDSYTSLFHRLKDQNIKVFPVGIGTAAGAPVPVAPNSRDYKRMKDKSVIISRLVDDDLRRFANEFGTTYVRLDNDLKNLDELISQIYSMTATPLEVSIEQVANNRFQFFLFAAIILLFASMIVMPIRKV
ncbi:MAG: VWA domain-containing protein [Bacteroidia bacterium]|nr:VWA domain-containing protein [Bacteroidia bacterium]